VIRFIGSNRRLALIAQEEHPPRTARPHLRHRDHQSPTQAAHHPHPQRRDHRRHRLRTLPHTQMTRTMLRRNTNWHTGTKSLRHNHLHNTGTIYRRSRVWLQ
jgi:hypothetical protein